MRDKPGSHNEFVSEVEKRVQMKLLRIFLGCLIICFLIVLHLLFWSGLKEDAPAVVRVMFLPTLLWAWVVTCYVFHALWGIAQQHNEYLRELSHTDMLTGASTHIYLDERLAKEREKALATGKPAAFAYVRIVGLETVNLKHGNTAGNLVLKDLASRMVEQVGSAGIVARVAGLQFAVLLPQTTLADARIVLERVLHDIRGYSLDLGKRGTISGLEARIGIAVFPSDGETLDDISRAAQDVAARTDQGSGVRVAR